MADWVGRHNVRVLGEGERSVVLGHGLGTDQSIWRLLAPRMAKDHRVVLVDWAGCGGSDPSGYDSDRHASLRGHGEDLCALLAHLDLGPVTYIGHSAGSMIGLLASLVAPSAFRGLVMICASPRYLDDPPGYTGGMKPQDVDALLSLLDENFVGWSATLSGAAAKEPAVQQELQALFAKNNRARLKEFTVAALRSDYRAELAKVTVPPLLIGATRDDLVPVGVHDYLHARLPGSSAVCLDIAGHCPQITHPELVEGAVRDYLREREH